jgi:hypothetical protein
MLNDFKDTSFRLKRVDGVMVKDETLTPMERCYYGVARTHIEIIKEARFKGLKTVLILEDDCKPEPNFEANWLQIKNYLDSHLDDWEVFNGCICGIESISQIVQLDNIFLFKEKGGSFCHWLYLNVEKAYDKLLNWEEKRIEIDLYYSTHFNHYTCYPILAEQYDGYSDIGEKVKDWSLNFLITRLTLTDNLKRFNLFYNH